MAKKYSTPSISCAIYSRTDRISAHGHGNSFHIFVSKNRGRFKVDPFTSSSPETLSLPRRPSFPPPPPPPSLSWRPFSAKGWKSPKAICRGKLYATSGALSRHALQAQSAISCVDARMHVYREVVRGKLFLARGIRGLEALARAWLHVRRYD